MRPIRSRRAMALFVVLGVMALLVVYAATAQTSVMAGLGKAKHTRMQLNRRVATENLLALASTWRQGCVVPVDVPGQPGQTAEVTMLPMMPDDAIWVRMPGLKPLAGDSLVTIRWEQHPIMTCRYLINLEGRRRGSVALPGIAKTR